MRQGEIAAHEHLGRIVRPHERDYEPWGKVVRWEDPGRAYPDCSCGCKWYIESEGELGFDWGVCTNPASHRCGLLTFEHQGCERFEAGDIEDGGAVS
jgi:hypothetical protein